MLQPNPGDLSINDIIAKIESGEYLIPRFQREFVWSKEQCARLIDSVLQGYPIGAFIIWKTSERLKNLKKIGNMDLPDPPDNGFVYYVLDGQQRITSLYVSIKGGNITRASGQVENYSEITVDLVASDGEQIVYQDGAELDPKKSISLVDLINSNMVDLMFRFNSDKDIIGKIDDYRQRINSYKFSIIELSDATIEVATEVFTRLNVSGKPLSAFEIMCAKMYDEARDFDLLSKREEQIEEWKSLGWETIPNTTVLQAMSAVIKGTCSGKDILSLDKDKFIDEWDNVNKAFASAIDYLKNAYGVVVSKLIPYDALLVPFVYYFKNHPNKPTGNEKLYLQDYFWRCVVSTRFTEGLVSKLGQDIENVIKVILEGKRPAYDHGVDISIETLKLKGTFSTGSAFSRGMLCILSAQGPRSFDDDVKVTIDNAWLSQGNSKNYHHFFPKKYMEKHHREIEAGLVNHVANITIIDSFLNKNVIKAKAPNVYMSDFIQKNEKINETMRTHLIELENDAFGVMNDNYILFFQKRLEAFQNELKKRLLIIPNVDVVE